MKVVNKNDYQEIRTWIHRNARQLELSVWDRCAVILSE